MQSYGFNGVMINLYYEELTLVWLNLLVWIPRTNKQNFISFEIKKFNKLFMREKLFYFKDWS